MQSNTPRSTYLRRFLIALPAVAALVLTFLFFSPTEIVMSNSSDFLFSGPGTVVPIMGLISAVLIIVGAAVLAAFRGRLYEALTALCLAFALCLYVQGTFMAKDTPPLSGDDVDWGALKGKMLVNAAVWVVLFCIPFVLLRSKTVWSCARFLIPALILVMQLTGFFSLLTQPDTDSYEPSYLSYDEFCDYSDQGNTLVFMLDRMDHNYIDGVLADDPAFFDRLDGFTCYDNAISQFAHTRPAMNFMLTGYTDTLFKEKATDFFYHSWDDGQRHILQDLTDAGYTVDLYGVTNSLLGKNFSDFEPWVSNIRTDMANISYKRFLKRMVWLSAYRDFPLAVKSHFLHSTSWFNKVFKTGGSNYETNPTIFDARMADMTVSSDGPYFKFYEQNGSHSPYTLNADGTQSDTRTDIASQTKGSFEILLRAFDRMKAAGIYKDTAILILADHGAIDDDYEPLLHPTRIGLFYKPAGVEGTPLQYSYAPVSLRNIPATILKASGVDYSAYGVPLDEVPDDESIVRDHIRTIADEEIGWRDCWALYYEVAYDAADMDSWTLKDKESIQYPLGF